MSAVTGTARAVKLYASHAHALAIRDIQRDKTQCGDKPVASLLCAVRGTIASPAHPREKTRSVMFSHTTVRRLVGNDEAPRRVGCYAAARKPCPGTPGTVPTRVERFAQGARRCAPRTTRRRDADPRSAARQAARAPRCAARAPSSGTPGAPRDHPALALQPARSPNKDYYYTRGSPMYTGPSVL